MRRYLFLFFIVSVIGCAEESNKQFISLSSEVTGIDFINKIDDTDSLHIMNFEYIYNGGGVAIGDFNNDALPDVFFTANMVANALYLNKGNFKFKDISDASGISKHERWSSGATVVDINADGLQDIYVCSTGHDKTKDKSNLLLINKGLDENGIPKFEEMASTYGVKESTNSTHAVFFDYDNDGDLDLFIIANEMPPDRSPSRYRPKVLDGSSNTTDHLYENHWDESLGHPVFTEVSKDAGILVEGYSLGVNICDINQDGWKDIFVSNDYLSNDILYINNQDGTFTDRASELFKHTAFSAMGSDVIDLDNDGDSEVITVDMLPEDNYRRKTMLSPNKYSDYANNERFGFTYQFVRNTLQQNNSDNGALNGNSIFSDVAFMSGVSSTDWSWTPLIADFDNDADRDMIITNGFPKDITDRDFINYSTTVKRFAEEQFILQKVPSVRLLNYAYRNDGGLKFENVTDEWGIEEPTFSNGAAYADLDNDGDLDYVVNNINSPASLFKNTSQSFNNWLRIKLEGTSKNLNGIGAVISVYTDSIAQSVEHNPYRGYLSSYENLSHFGLGQSSKIDSIIVDWNSGKQSVIKNVEVNQLLHIKEQSSTINKVLPKPSKQLLFTDVADEVGLEFIHEESDVIDFNSQPLLLHKLSQYGPGLSVGDVNGDGLDDLFISGSAEKEASIYHQTPSGEFIKSNSINYSNANEIAGEDLGAVFFDADNDGDQDLYIVRGGNEYVPDSEKYQDAIYMNVNGLLSLAINAIPRSSSSGICVRAADFDKDGLLDLFVGSRILAGQYPTSGKSQVLKNVSKKDDLKFDVVLEDELGMITDALWTDYDGDSDLDLLVVGELMQITIVKNDGSNFDSHALFSDVGFWNSIAAGDIDNDGDTDYIIGNTGTNILAQVNDHHPIRIYYKDFDGNGVKDLIPTCYFLDEQGELNEYTYHNSLDVAKQYNNIKKQFVLHGEYAKVSFKDVFTKAQFEDCDIYEVNQLHSVVLLSDGVGSFDMTVLPDIVQRSPIYGMQFIDLNDDEYLDIMMVGNDYGMEVGVGRLDAHDGLVGYGKGDGSFDFETGHINGFLVQEDAKALVQLYHKASNQNLLIASQNQGKLKVYAQKHVEEIIELMPDDVSAEIIFENGQSRKVEFYLGNGFISQSGRHIAINEQVKSIKIFSTNGKSREINF